MLPHNGDEVPHYLSVTVDHLCPRGRIAQSRPYVGAHRGCNNARGHNEQVDRHTIDRVERALEMIAPQDMPALPQPRAMKDPRSTPRVKYVPPWPPPATTPMAEVLAQVHL